MTLSKHSNFMLAACFSAAFQPVPFPSPSKSVIELGTRIKLKNFKLMFPAGSTEFSEIVDNQPVLRFIAERFCYVTDLAGNSATYAFAPVLHDSSEKRWFKLNQQFEELVFVDSSNVDFINLHAFLANKDYAANAAETAPDRKPVDVPVDVEAFFQTVQSEFDVAAVGSGAVIRMLNVMRTIAKFTENNIIFNKTDDVSRYETDVLEDNMIAQSELVIESLQKLISTAKELRRARAFARC
ncbi:hypothetical protein [Zymomonas mobilis]|uniref:hypothetical protein n=1 Tax=Zymomonas mobilis TaxID=542 RepID=UPI0039E9A24A